MNKKQILRTVLFFIAVFIILVVLCDLFEYKIDNISRRYEKFKVLEDDTVDAVYIGSSAVDRYWINAKAYEEYGMTVYPASSEGLPAWLYIPMIKEVYKYQDPKLLILDIRPFLTGNYSEHIDITDVRCRRIIDMLDFFSPNRFDAIRRTEQVMREIDEDFSVFDSMYFFSFVRYHNKWSDDSFTFDELGAEQAGYMGFYVAKTKSVKRVKIKNSVYTNESIALDEISERYLYELLDYIKENKLNVLFVDSPNYISERESALRNTLAGILEKEGFDYVSYNTPEADEEYNFYRGAELSDFYNAAHVNYYGAEKYTAIFAEYLAEHYDLPDRRGEEAVKKDWDGIYAKIKSKIAAYEGK